MGRTKPVAQSEPAVDGSVSTAQEAAEEQSPRASAPRVGESNFTAENIPPSLASKIPAALLKAQRTVKAVAKDGSNTFHKYNYATSEDVIDEGRIALNAAGLTLSQAEVKVELFQYETAPGKSKGGGGGGRYDRDPREDDAPREAPRMVLKNGVKIKARYMLLHESGEASDFFREWYGIEESGRPLDKTLAGSLTTALAYAMRDILLIPRSDRIADMDRRDDTDYNAERERDRDRDRGTPEASPAAARRDEPKREEPKAEPRKEEPKAKKGYEAEEQPYASDDTPSFGTTDDAWETCLELVVGNGKWSTIEATDSYKRLGESETAALGLLYDARGARSSSEFGDISAKIRLENFPAEVDERVKKALRLVWDEIKKGL